MIRTLALALSLLYSSTALADDTALRMHTYLQNICPDVVGVAQNADQSWSVTYEGGHNCAAAANAAIAAFNPFAVTLPHIITKTAFLARFTPSELIAISQASRTNDTINIWLITAQAYTNIDLNDPLTDQGLSALVFAGLLTPERKAVILGL